MNHLTAAQIRQYHALGYVAGPQYPELIAPATA